MTRITALAVCTGLVLVLAPGLALAGPPPVVTCADLVSSGQCDEELSYLCSVTEDAATPPLKQRDKDSLIGKVVMASIKLDQGKKDDAAQKLGDYEQKLDQLANAPKMKIAPGDVTRMSAALIAAQICVASL